MRGSGSIALPKGNFSGGTRLIRPVDVAGPGQGPLYPYDPLTQCLFGGLHHPTYEPGSGMLISKLKKEWQKFWANCARCKQLTEEDKLRIILRNLPEVLQEELDLEHEEGRLPNCEALFQHLLKNMGKMRRRMLAPTGNI